MSDSNNISTLSASTNPVNASSQSSSNTTPIQPSTSEDVPKFDPTSTEIVNYSLIYYFITLFI